MHHKNNPNRYFPHFYNNFENLPYHKNYQIRLRGYEQRLDNGWSQQSQCRYDF
uniref:Uncharacterized protein n=1 Tax=Haemonchus contortus TaxID=6289 RepID=A0A7I4YTB1_HAECO